MLVYMNIHRWQLLVDCKSYSKQQQQQQQQQQPNNNNNNTIHKQQQNVNTLAGIVLKSCYVLILLLTHLALRFQLRKFVGQPHNLFAWTLVNTLAVLLTSENLQCCLCQSLFVSGNQTLRQQPVKMRGREGERKGRKEEKRKRGGRGRRREKEKGGEGSRRGRRSDVWR